MIFSRKSSFEPIRMSNMQVSIPQSGAVTSANKEEESESVEETTLTEVKNIVLHNVAKLFDWN